LGANGRVWALRIAVTNEGMAEDRNDAYSSSGAHGERRGGRATSQDEVRRGTSQGRDGRTDGRAPNGSRPIPNGRSANGARPVADGQSANGQSADGAWPAPDGQTTPGDQAAGSDSDNDSGGLKLRIGVAASITAVGGLLFGYDTGVVSGALLYVKKSFGLSSFQQELVTSLLLVGCMIGALTAGRIADKVGRKLTVLGTAIVFIIGVLLAAFTPTYGVLLVARVVIGLAVGTSSMIVPLYIGEVVPPRSRGALVSLNQLAITIGILTSYLIAYGLASSGNWRLMFGLAAIPAAVLFVGMLFQRESPHWLVAQGREEEARATLRLVRGPQDDIDAEVAEVKEVSRRSSGIAEVFASPVRRVLLIGVMLAVFQQITGVNTIIYYAPTLLQGAGFGNSAAILAEVGVGGVNVLLTIAAVLLLDRVGRRPLLLTGTVGMFIGLVVVALTFIHGQQLSGTPALVAVAGLMLYQASFAIGLGPVFWLLIAEIYPLKVRGAAMSVATIANWAANFVVTISFLTLLSAIGGTGVFFLYAFLTLVALFYFNKMVPETKGRSLQEIERELDPQLAAMQE
jgi:sugar porter (SP) family MFS transporter